MAASRAGVDSMIWHIRMCSSTGTTSSMASPMLVPGPITALRSASSGRLRGGRAAHGLEEARLDQLLDGEGDVLLAGEVAEEGALGDVDGVDDLVDGRRLVALLREELEGGADQGVPGALLLALTQSRSVAVPPSLPESLSVVFAQLSVPVSDVTVTDL